MNRNKQVIRIGISGFTAILFVLLALTGNAENKINAVDEPGQVELPEFAISRRYEPVKNRKDTATVGLTDVFSNSYDISKYEKVYSAVEKMPQFPGGEKALFQLISNSIHYPPIDRDFGISGKVIVRFIVTKKGTIRNVEIVRSLENYFDKEAVRVIKKLPAWIPGEHDGKKVAVYYTIPVTFKLE